MHGERLHEKATDPEGHLKELNGFIVPPGAGGALKLTISNGSVLVAAGREVLRIAR